MKNNGIKLCVMGMVAAMVLAGCSTWKKTTSVKNPPIASSQPKPGVSLARSTIAEPSGTAPADVQIPMPASNLTTGVVQTGDQGTIELRKEELVVGKRTVSNGGVVLRTTVQSENVSKPIDLAREEYVIERIPASEAAAWATNTATVFEGQEIYLPLTREEPVASKRAVLVEKVQIGKRVETDAVTVTHPVRTESVEVVKTAAPPPSAPISFAETPVAAAPAELNNDIVQLAREEIVVGKRQVENGAVRLRKVITTQDASQPLNLKREEYTVIRTPLGEQSSQDVSFNPRQVKLGLVREEPVVGTQNKLTEVVRVRKQVVTDKQVVSGTVLKEGFELVKTANTGQTSQSVTITPAVETNASIIVDPAGAKSR